MGKRTPPPDYEWFKDPPGIIEWRPELVAKIAAIVYPDEEPKPARRKIRDRIKYAIETSKEVVGQGYKADAHSLYRWLAKKYPETVEAGLIHPAIPVEAAAGCLYRLDAFEPHERHDVALLVIEDLKRQLAAANQKIEQHEKRDAERRRQASINGKKGGRGNYKLGTE